MDPEALYGRHPLVGVVSGASAHSRLAPIFLPGITEDLARDVAQGIQPVSLSMPT